MLKSSDSREKMLHLGWW
jgi:hypothetical protein